MLVNLFWQRLRMVFFTCHRERYHCTIFSSKPIDYLSDRWLLLKKPWNSVNVSSYYRRKKIFLMAFLLTETEKIVQFYKNKTIQRINYLFIRNNRYIKTRRENWFWLFLCLLGKSWKSEHWFKDYCDIYRYMKKCMAPSKTLDETIWVFYKL